MSSIAKRLEADLAPAAAIRWFGYWRRPVDNLMHEQPGAGPDEALFVCALVVFNHHSLHAHGDYDGL